MADHRAQPQVDTVAVDVVVVGGGIQGLVLLRELTAAGYACALVTNAPLGAGQTLHSHGALVSGTGLVTGGLSESVEGVTVPYLRRHGVPVQREDPSFLMIPDGMVDDLAPVWRANDYSPERSEPSTLPAVQSSAQPYRVPGCNVDKLGLVEALSLGLEPHIIGGEIVDADGALRVRTLRGERVQLHTRAVVVAAGCGTKAVLRQTFGLDGGLVERITYSKMHMLCLKAPAGLLPTIGAVVSPGLLVVGHQRNGGRGAAGAAAIWYVTPVDPSAAAHSEARDDAVADVEARVVALAAEALMSLVPALRRDGEGVTATVFAGYKQDFDGEPTRRACELVDADRNLLVALPSVLANAVPNALDAVGTLRRRIDPSGRTPDLPGAGGLAVGNPHEDGGHVWRRWPDFVRTYVG